MKKWIRNISFLSGYSLAGIGALIGLILVVPGGIFIACALGFAAWVEQKEDYSD